MIPHADKWFSQDESVDQEITDWHTGEILKSIRAMDDQYSSVQFRTLPDTINEATKNKIISDFANQGWYINWGYHGYYFVRRLFPGETGPNPYQDYLN